MPFSTDNSWPADLREIFDIYRDKNEPLKNCYYALYDKLLKYCFKDSQSFGCFVASQNPPRDGGGPETLGFIVFNLSLVVSSKDLRPVLFAEINDESWATNPGHRLKADHQLRDRYNFILDTCPLPRLWGMSLLGTSVRFYSGEVATGVVTPAYQGRPHEDDVVPPEFLQGDWNMDILSQEGFDKMKEIVLDITASVDPHFF